MDLYTILYHIMLLLPFTLGMLGMILASTHQENWGQTMGWVTASISFALLIMSFWMIRSPQAHSKDFSFLGILDMHVDSLSLFFILLVNGITFVASVNSVAYLGEKKRHNASMTPIENLLQQPTTFHSLVNLFHFTMLFVPMVDNMVALWVAIELTTVASAFLVAYRCEKSSWEAAWKYLIITSIGIILALLGTMFLANAAREYILQQYSEQVPPNSVMNWTFLLKIAEQHKLDSEFVLFAFIFALIGYGTKAGLAPMHTWLPDGHGEAPSPISALLSGVLLKAALYAILRFYTLTNVDLGNTTFTSSALLIASLFSLVVATPLILKENLFKRVLAYHSLEHMGIITFGVALGGPITIFGALLHMLNHAITKALMFLAFGNVMQQYEAHGIRQKDITGILRSMPLAGSFLALGGLALVGTPPFNVFMSEFIILWGAINQLLKPGAMFLPEFEDWIIITAILLFMLSTTFIFYGLVKHLGRLLLHKMPNDEHLEKFGFAETAPLIILSFFMLLLGLWVFPSLANLINESVKIILGKV